MRHRARGTSARLDLRARARGVHRRWPRCRWRGEQPDGGGRELAVGGRGPVVAGRAVPRAPEAAARSPAMRLSVRRTATKRTGVPGTAWAAAGQVGRADHRDHRVAAGGRVVGEEDHRAAVRRHLDRAQDHALAGEFAVRARSRAGPSVRSPMRLLAGDTR